jgi:NAD(P)-dependent dehydrogenase (short-subunit alcohol dehydrogenase family)
MTKIAVVTGAGTGVGRAIVHALARDAWSVALIGRTPATLDEAIAAAPPAAAPGAPARLLAIPCDVGDSRAVEQMAARVRDALGDPEVLVNSAGINIARRAMADLSIEDFDELIAVNLSGAFYCARAFLPSMRARGRGTILNIGSDAGIYANPISGPAYIASKFGLTGLTGAINAEERKNGIRACAIQPGEINTPLLDKRPTPPPHEARAKMLQAEDVAACAMLAINLPDRAVVEQLLVRPR